MGTSGMVSHWLGGRTYDCKNWVVGGIFRELSLSAVEQGIALLPQPEPEGRCSPHGWCTGGPITAGVPFDPFAMAALLDDKLEESHVTVLLHTRCVNVIMEENAIRLVVIHIPDTIGYSAYGWDLPTPERPSENPDVGRECGIRKDMFAISYRVIVPRPVTNLLCAGRSISVEREVFGPLRVMAPCMAMGEAAGLTACQAVRDKLSFSDVDTQCLRAALRKQGAIEDEGDAKPGRPWFALTVSNARSPLLAQRARWAPARGPCEDLMSTRAPSN